MLFRSGTSGASLKVYYSKDCILNEAAHNEVFRNNAGHQIGQKTVSMRGVLGHSQLKKFDRFSNILFLSSFNLNKKNFSFYYNQIKNFSPNTILAYPSSLEILANLILQNDKQLHVPVIFTSSETLYDFQREKIEKAFDSKVFDRYGNAERTISLIQKEHNGEYKEAALYSINEYRKDKIITTNLISPTFPLIRYEVDDIVKLGKSENEVSVEEIIGRVDDVLVLPDGTEIGRMDLVFKSIENLFFAQFLQSDKEFFTLNLVVTQNFSIRDETKLRKNIAEQIGGNLTYKIKFIDENQLIKTKSGKYKLVINTTK